jgi:hypothetical protein
MAVLTTNKQLSYILMILENLQYGNFVTDSIRIFDKRNTTGATSSAGTSYPFGAPLEFVEFVLLNLEFSE